MEEEIDNIQEMFEEAIAETLFQEFVDRTLDGFGDFFLEKEGEKERFCFYYFDKLMELRWSGPEIVGAIIYPDSRFAKSILLDIAKNIEMGPEKNQLDNNIRVFNGGVLKFLEEDDK